MPQVMKPRIRHDSSPVACPGPERPKVIRTQRSLPLAARKHPLAGRRFGEAMQQLPRSLAEQNVPRSRLRVNQGEPLRLDLAPPQATYLTRPACGQQEQAHRGDADRVLVLTLAQDRAARSIRSRVRFRRALRRPSPCASANRAPRESGSSTARRRRRLHRGDLRRAS